MPTKLKQLLAANPDYDRGVKQFKPLDGWLAIGLVGLNLTLNFILGVYQRATDIYIGEALSIVTIMAVLGLLAYRRQELPSVGVTRSRFKPSLLLGLVSAIIICLVVLIPGWLNQRTFVGFSQFIHDGFYYLAAIAFVEELMFRGYVQPRLHALIRRPLLAIAAGGLLSVVSHLPYRLALGDAMTVDFAISVGFTFIWHLVFNFLYRKHNSLVAPAIGHWFLNWANYFFN